MLKPIDILNTEFKQGFKGYNVEEVDAFLANIVGKYESLIQENKKLEDEIARLQTSLKEYQNKEQDIHGLIALTRETVSEAKAVVNQQAEAILEEANLQAKLIIDKAELAGRQQLSAIQEETKQAQAHLDELVQHEKAFKEKMRQLMETFWGMIESVGHDIPIKEKTDLAQTKMYREVAVTDIESDLD